MRLRDLAVLKGGITKGNKRSRTSPTRLVPYLRVANVQRGFLDLEEVKEIEADETEINALQLQPGDVLFNEGGDRDKLGRGWIWNGELPICIHQNHVFRARIRDGMLLPKLLSWYGNSVGQLYFLEHGKQTTNLASINLTLLGDLPVPVPPPAEQAPLVAEVETQTSRIEAGVAALTRVQANLKRYRASVLKAACEGRLVPTEAELARRESRDYEPASVLLQRVLKERRRHWEASELSKLKAKGKPPSDDRWKTKYDEPIRLTDGALPALPEGWCWASFDQLVVNHDGKRVPLKRSDRAERRGEFPYYGASGQIDTIDEFLFDGSYLLIGEDGANLLSRSTPIAFQVHGKFWVNNHAHVVSPAGGTPLGYLEMLLNGMDLSPYVTGTAQPKLPQSSMNKIPLPLAPLQEQQRVFLEVERRLSLADGLRQAVASNTARSDHLRKAILESAFSGKLTGAALANEPRVPTQRVTSSLKRLSAGEGHASGL